MLPSLLTLFALSLYPFTTLSSPNPYPKIIHCLTTHQVSQAYPGTSSFKSFIIPLNLRLNYTPIALALPTTIPQIQDAVRCASKLGVKVNPRSGGHSYASHSLGGEDGHLVVDLKYFRDVVVDRKTNVATIGPGARLGNVALALFEQGERALPHGLCPGVGIGGHVLHGGQGYSTHTHGLLLDHLISATLILPNSSLTTVSRTQHSSLFWALRGAGMSFGIVTSLQFLTLPAPPQNILFYYPYLWTEAQARLGWDVWQSYCGGFTTPIIPREMNIRWVVASYGGGFAVFLLEGHYHGSQADFDLAIEPLLSALGKIGGLQESVRGVGAHPLGWIDALLYANNNGLFGDLGSGETLETELNYTAHSTFFTKSLMTSNLSPPSIDTFLNRLYTTNPPNPVTTYLIIFAQGGPTSAVPLNAQTYSSYAHRHSLYEWQFIASVPSPPFPATGVEWLNAFVGDIERAEVDAKRAAAGGSGGKLGWGGGEGVLGAYYNYADPSLGRGEKAGGRYWLTNYPLLKALKQKYDPDFVFMNPQTVGT